MVNSTAILFITITALTIGTVFYLNAETQTPQFTQTTFMTYQSSFQKRYSSESEEKYRRFVYNTNKAYINQENAKGKSFILGDTPFTDMTFEEFKAKYLMSKTVATPPADSVEVDMGVRDFCHKDWRDDGVVSGVKNQGGCGSCWAFSAVGSLETAYALKNKKLVEFSEQELVDCSGDYGNNGCGGGLPTFAFDYIKDHKISLEKDYTYTAEDRSCKAKKYPDRYGIKGYKTLKPANVDGLLKAINEQPVSVGIEVQNDFMHYTSGIYTNDNCGQALNHGVTAVGFNVEKDESKSYFIVKNSWGNRWGEKGYIRMLVGHGNGTCGIANSYDAYPLF